MEDSDIPSDPTFRAAWTLDFTHPDGYGADYGQGSKNTVTAWKHDGTPVLRSEA